MALIGGGGAGNVAGSTFTGGSKALDIIGNFAYAYNEVATSLLQSPTATLSFTTGNYVFEGNWIVCGSVNKDGVSETGGVDQFYLKLNSTTVMSVKVETNQEDSPTTYTVPILIPPFTLVETLADCTVNNSNWLVSNSLIGRIYA